MEKVTIQLKEIKKVDRFCDFCGKPAKGRHCRICQRDLCDEHAHRESDPLSDYSFKYCIQCWKIGEPFRRRISVLSEIYEKEIEDLENEWEKKALEAVKRSGDMNDGNKK